MNDIDKLNIIHFIISSKAIPKTKIELVEKFLRNCKEKEIGKLLLRSVRKKTRQLDSNPKGKRGRPKGSKNKRSPHVEKMISMARESDKQNGLIQQ